MIGKVGQIIETPGVAVAAGVDQKIKEPISAAAAALNGPPGAVFQQARQLGRGQIDPGSPKVGGVDRPGRGQGGGGRSQGRGDQGGRVDHARQ